MFEPRLAEYIQLCADYNLVPVYKEILVDMETPISVFKKVCPQENTYLLESVEGGENLARFSFIGFDPYIIYTHKDGQGEIYEKDQKISVQGNPLEVLEDLMKRFKAPQIDNLPRFYGGAVGFFGYDMIRYIEDLPNKTEDDLKLFDSYFLITKTLLIFDHVKHTLKIVVNTRPGRDLNSAYNQAVAQIEKVIYLIENRDPRSKTPKPQIGIDGLKANMTREEYMLKVEQAKEYIKAGDIFQVVLSQRLQAPVSGDPFDIYRSLRNVNPAPYLYYLNFNGTVLIGSSPEMLVRVEDGMVTSRPIAGTRPRGGNLKEDVTLAEDLLTDKKEQAEHVMLVDLGRNDLGRVCKFGSVEVTEFMAIEKYSHVMHIVSNVQGELAEGKNAFDVLKATFPAGTLTGAPKIRAMEIIEQLESKRRGAYGGAIGYFGFTGNVDTCITIRTLLVHDGQIYIQAGAGIVADSDPATEYQETMNKAKALISTLPIKEV